MSTTLQDGTGTKNKVKIDSENRLYVKSITESEFDSETRKGDAYNINTEFITITGSTETPLLYLKNNDERDLVLSAWFIGTDASLGSATRLSLMRVYTNPTSGTIISSGTNVTAVNRLIGSANEFNGDAKKGGDGFTFGGNSTTPVLYQTQGTSQRNFGTVQITLKKGSSVVVTYQQYGLTSQDVYTGFQVYLSDTNL
jgi:hypothetical protein